MWVTTGRFLRRLVKHVTDVSFDREFGERRAAVYANMVGREHLSNLMGILRRANPPRLCQLNTSGIFDLCFAGEVDCTILMLSVLISI